MLSQVCGIYQYCLKSFNTYECDPMHGDYLPTNKKVNEIIETCIPENTHKAIQNVQKIQDGSDYSYSLLVNAYNYLSNYIYKHLDGSKKFVINNKNEFPLL
ncbi:21816_t:CDS:2 [Cetraspora pellucida]|uniref:21816_t:CDS:1 n=1 Tax=Cetraspora pellucida TaxID=1433469 RepID=A0A9N9CDR8_9GLOM|nr:21816_t:CDS:2 [Cetraspora pellucida]